jgi:phosphate-selective porin OprO/OprP
VHCYEIATLGLLTVRAPNESKEPSQTRQIELKLTMINKYITLSSLGITVLLACVSAAPAGQPSTEKTVLPPEEAKSLCGTIFSIPTLYKNEENPVIQKFALIGRYQGQYYSLDSNQGDAHDWENRRVRLGAAGQIFRDFKFSFNFNIGVDEDADRFFEDLEDAVVVWEPHKKFTLSLGKQKAPITQEWRTSSTKILEFERSLLVNQAVPGKLGGVLLTGKLDSGVTLEAGLYSGSVGDDWAEPTFDGGLAAFGSVGYTADTLGTIRGEYLFAESDEDSNAVKPYEHLFSVVYLNKWDRFSLMVNGIYAVGADRPDVYGVIVSPALFLTEKLQLVGRYQYAASEAEDGVRLQSRYEREAPELASQYGDNYHAVYAGLNYYICDHNLKLMAGVEYATMDQDTGRNYESVTFMTGVRLYF